MPCSHCHQTGHNIRTCPQRAVIDTTPTSPVSRETPIPSVQIRAHREPVARGSRGNFVTEILLENRNNYEVDIYLRRDSDPASQGLYTFEYSFESYDQGTILILNSDTSIIAVPKSSRTDMFPLADALHFSDLLLSTFPMGYYFTDYGYVDLERVHQFNDDMEASICVVTREGLGFGLRRRLVLPDPLGPTISPHVYLAGRGCGWRSAVCVCPSNLMSNISAASLVTGSTWTLDLSVSAAAGMRSGAAPLLLAQNFSARAVNSGKRQR